jgi:pimeloyl-ACP methyl ester carboxylesterase
MLMRCPTLAIWGSNDVQILPELNREKLLLAVERNQQLDASLVVIPGLNHLMQTCQTGLPEEYDQIEETVSPKALRVILDWAEDQGILER